MDCTCHTSPLKKGVNAIIQPHSHPTSKFRDGKELRLGKGEV